MDEAHAEQSVTVQFNVPAQMRDGVILRADVYRPSGEGPWPTLLARTPYDKGQWEMLSWLDPVKAAASGFIVVIQDARGRFASEGQWIPMHFEREDGYDSVEWAAKLPSSNGRVGMYGASYVGLTPWMAAMEQPPSLAAIAPGMTPADPLEGTFARGGALELGITPPWTLMMGCAHLQRLPLSEEQRQERLSALLDDLDLLPSEGYWGLPVQDLPVLRKHDSPDIGTLRMFEDPDVVARCRVAGQYERVTVPSFHIAGWHDLHVQGMLDNYVAMAALGRPARIVIGPWTHNEPFADPIGELCFGVRGSRLGAPVHAHGDLNDEQLAWFRGHLAPRQGGDADAAGPPVRIFVMGRNLWRDETAWPLTRARGERWFLGARGALRPDGPLADDEATEFVYDPGDPVLTHGGNTVMAPAFPPGPRDQAQVEARPDVCVFTSEPLRRELEVTGRVRVVLHAESSAPSTDWVARLCDVHPDGRSFNVCDGILRVQEGADACQRIEIDLWSTSNVFLVGHRLRVHVTSSSFPRWERNLNTGNQREARWQTARQRIHHATERPSWIELPVVEAER